MANHAEMIELLTRKEALHPELTRFLQPVDGALITCVQHPLLHELVYDKERCGILNAQYVARKERTKVLLEKKDLEAYLALVARPHRWPEFSKYVHLCSTEPAYWDLVAWLLIDTENQWQVADYIRAAMSPGLDPFNQLPRWTRHTWMMTPEELQKLLELPDTVTIWRGHNGKRKKGFSWTFDYEKAVWFARRPSSTGTPQVTRGTVLRKDVLAVFLGRNESEIFVMPENVRYSKTRKV